MSECKIHCVRHLDVSRAADAPAEWINNNLLSAEVDDAAEVRIPRDHLAIGDVGGEMNAQAVNFQITPHQGATVGINPGLHQVGSSAGVHQEVNATDVDVGIAILSSIEASSTLVGVEAVSVSGRLSCLDGWLQEPVTTVAPCSMSVLTARETTGTSRTTLLSIPLFPAALSQSTAPDQPGLAIDVEWWTSNLNQGVLNGTNIDEQGLPQSSIHNKTGDVMVSVIHQRRIQLQGTPHGMHSSI